VVPFNYDLEANPEGLEYDGIFLSNGPGDPTMVYSFAPLESFEMSKATVVPD